MADTNKWFWSCRELGFVITGQGSMNVFLFNKRLYDTEECDCGIG